MTNPAWRAWQSQWIAPRNSHETPPFQPYMEEGEQNAYYLFRHNFTLDSMPGKVLLAVTGSIFYRLYVNGSFADRGPVSSLAFYRYYNELDVTSFLHPGINTVAVELQVNGKTFQAGLLAELVDEKGRLVDGTNASWRCCVAEAWKTGTYRFSPSLYTPFQETFDARKMPENWMAPSFDDSHWSAAVPYVGSRGDDVPPAVAPWFRLVKRDIPFLRHETVRPEKILSLTENVHVQNFWRTPEDLSIPLSAAGGAMKYCRVVHADALCSGEGVCGISGFGSAEGKAVYDPAILLDFGRILRGYPCFEIEGPAGCRVMAGYAERLIDGEFNNAVGCAFADSFYLKDGITVWKPFVWKAFRYLKLRFWGKPPYTLKIRRFAVEREFYPFAGRTTFRTPDSVLQKVYDMCVNTVDLCTSDCIFDTPFRETGQWCYDTCGSILHSMLWGMGETAMARKYLDQTSHAMRPMGLPASISNYTGIMWKIFLDVGLLYPRAMWEYYRYSGDASLLYSEYPKLLTTLDFYRSFRNCDGLIEHLPDTFLDWAYNISDDARKGCSAAVNALFGWMLSILEKIAALYGDAYREKQCREEYEELKAAFCRTFLMPEGNALSDGIFHGKKSAAVSEYACALAIHAGLLPESVRNLIVDAVFDRRSVKALEGEPFACHTIMTALDKAGRFDLVLRMIRERWGERWAAKNYTSTPENWDADYCTGEWSSQHTMSHAWSGGPAELLTHQLLGVEILEPGFKAIRLSPKKIDFDVSLELKTPRGTISGICRNGEWKLTVPETIAVR